MGAIDRVSPARQYGDVLWRLVLGAMLCLLGWTASQLLVRTASAGHAAPAHAASSLAGAAEDANAPEQWIAGRRATASTTESGWRTQLQHASLATLPGAIVFDTKRSRHVSHRPVRPGPHHAFVIPLLI
jgi:hypothetical protein